MLNPKIFLSIQNYHETKDKRFQRCEVLRFKCDAQRQSKKRAVAADLCHTHIRKTAKMEEEGNATISLEMRPMHQRIRITRERQRAENVTSDYRIAILLQS